MYGAYFSYTLLHFSLADQQLQFSFFDDSVKRTKNMCVYKYSNNKPWMCALVRYTKLSIESTLKGINAVHDVYIFRIYT